MDNLLEYTLEELHEAIRLKEEARLYEEETSEEKSNLCKVTGWEDEETLRKEMLLSFLNNSIESHVLIKKEPEKLECKVGE